MILFLQSMSNVSFSIVISTIKRIQTHPPLAFWHVTSSAPLSNVWNTWSQVFFAKKMSKMIKNVRNVYTNLLKAINRIKNKWPIKNSNVSCIEHRKIHMCRYNRNHFVCLFERLLNYLVYMWSGSSGSKLNSLLAVISQERRSHDAL